MWCFGKGFIKLKDTEVEAVILNIAFIFRLMAFERFFLQNRETLFISLGLDSQILIRSTTSFLRSIKTKNLLDVPYGLQFSRI